MAVACTFKAGTLRECRPSCVCCVLLGNSTVCSWCSVVGGCWQARLRGECTQKPACLPTAASLKWRCPRRATAPGAHPIHHRGPRTKDCNSSTTTCVWGPPNEAHCHREKDASIPGANKQQFWHQHATPGLKVQESPMRRHAGTTGSFWCLHKVTIGKRPPQRQAD